MLPEKPAKNISQDLDYPDFKNYRIHCNCGDPDCDVHMYLEVEEDGDTGEFELTFYTTQKTNWQERLKVIWQVLTRGYAEYTHGMILSRQGALNLASVIQKFLEENPARDKKQ